MFRNGWVRVTCLWNRVFSPWKRLVSFFCREALEMAYDMGICKSIGVSNYLKKHLEELQLFSFFFFAARHVPLNVCCECILGGGFFQGLVVNKGGGWVDVYNSPSPSEFLRRKPDLHTSERCRLVGFFLWLFLCWLVVSNILYVHPYLVKIPILTNIFQVGWNHQPGFFLWLFLWLGMEYSIWSPFFCVGNLNSLSWWSPSHPQVSPGLPGLDPGKSSRILRMYKPCIPYHPWDWNIYLHLPEI